MSLISASRLVLFVSLLGAFTLSNAQTATTTNTTSTDFDAFNQLFQNAQLLLPDADISTNGLDLNLRELICSQVIIDDMTLLSPSTAATNITSRSIQLQVNVRFSLVCQANYGYTFPPFFRGDGRVAAMTRDNQFTTHITVAHGSATDVTVDLCQAAVQIYDLDFRGGLVARLVEVAEKPVADLLQNKIQDALCEQLSTNGGAAIENLLDTFLQRVDPVAPVLLTPALAEQKVLSSIKTDDLFDFQQHEWLARGLEQVQSFLGSSSEGGGELGINSLLRTRMLNGKGVLRVNLGGVMKNTTILSSHGRLTKSSIVLQNLDITGLDSLTQFDALQIVGNYTVRNTLRWESLRIRIQARVIMQASSQNNSLFVVDGSTEPKVIEEDIIIVAGLKDLAINLNLLFATEEVFWKNMPLANLLKTSTVYNCFLQSIKVWNITEFTATAGQIVRPRLEGFVDAGLDRIASSAVDAFVNLLEPTFQAALPNLAQTLLRDWINTDLLPNLRNDIPTCPTSASWPAPVVDFRDLLLSPSKAQALGGSGTQPYGDLVQYAYDAVSKKFGQVDELNDFLIRPFTSSQSGVEGTLSLFNESLVVVDHSLVDLSLSDLQIRNLDTIQHDPIQVLNPTNDATVLANEIQLGNGTVGKASNVTADPSALTFAFQTQFRLGDWVPQQSVGFSITMPKVTLDTSLNLAMNSTFVSNLPLGHVSKLGCWMKSIVTQNSDMIQALSLEMTPWHWQAQCVNCSSDILSSVLDKMQTSPILSEQWPVLVTDLLKSDWIEEWLLYKVDSASCPLIPSVSSAIRPVGIPVLSNASLDTALYTGVASLWTTFLVIMEQHELKELADDLTNWTSTVDGADLIDFTNLGNSTGLGTLADEALQQGRAYLLSKDETTQEPKINALMRDLLLSDDDDSGDYVLRVPNMEQVVFQQANGLLLRIDSVAVRGLDTFTELDLLKPVNPQLLWSALKMRSLSFQVGTTVGYSSGPQQNLTFSFELEDLELELGLFAAFPLDAIERIPLKSVLQLKNLLPCILSTAKNVEIPRFNAKIGNLVSMQVHGLRSETDQAMSDLIDETLEEYRQTIISGLPKLATSTLRTLLSNKLSKFISSSSCPPSTTSSTGNPFVDLRELLLTPEVSQEYGGAGEAPYGNIFPTIAKYIEEKILATDPKTGDLMLNKLISSFTKSRSGSGGSLLWPGDLLSTNTNVDAGGLNARVRLRVYDAFIHHIDSFSGDDIQILEPVRGEPHQANNTASIGKRQPIEMGAGFAVEFFSPGATNINNDLKLSLSVEDVQVLFTMLVKIVEASFLNLPLTAIGNLDCWLATFEKPKLDQFGVSQSPTALELLELSLRVTQLRMNATCVSCSGPKMEEFTRLISEASAVEDMTRVANRILGYLKSVLGGNYLQVTLDRMIAEGHRKCPYGSDYGQPAPVFQSLPEPDTSESISLLVALFVSAFVLIAGIVIILSCRRLVVRMRHRKWVQTLAEDQLYHLWNIQTEQDKFDEEVNSRSTSLYLSKEIPRFARFFIPLSIVGNVALFLSGHLSLGGSVTIVLQLAGESYTADNFFEFSMAKSAIEIWNAGGKELAIMILIFSGIWPYTKCVATMVLWFAPPRMCPVDRRESILLWLDALAKWSFVDIFILVMTLAAFRVSVQSPGVAFLPESFYSLDLLVIPKWGLYANMIAQLVSQISSHFIIHYHRLAVSKTMQNMTAEVTTPKTFEIDDDDNTTDASLSTEDDEDKLCEHQFERPHRAEDEKLVVRKYVDRLVTLMTVSTVGLVIAGCSVPSYGVDILGMVGLLVESGQEFSQAVSQYNLFDTMQLLFNQASFTGRPADYIGLGTLSIILLITVLLVPLIQSALLMYLWFKPMAAKQRYQGMVALEVLSAWQYAEVFLLSVMVASWQLGPVSEYMINAYCGSLRGFFSQLVFYGVVEEQDAQCFRVNTTIDKGFFVLVAGALLLALLNTFVIHAVRQQQRDKARSPFCGSTFGCGEGLEQVRKAIHPAPVLFTDSFRWLLRRPDEDN